MTALLQALDPARRKRTPIIVGAAFVLTDGATATVAWAVASKEAGCPDPKRRLAGVWDDAVKRKVGAQFAGLGKQFATDVWAADAPRLDAYTKAWTDMSAASCKATRVDHTQNE